MSAGTDKSWRLDEVRVEIAIRVLVAFIQSDSGGEKIAKVKAAVAYADLLVTELMVRK